MDGEDILIFFFTALQEVHFHAIFQCLPDGIIGQNYAKLANKPEKLHLWVGEAPHYWLFSKCAVILHHGGSGTVATALHTKKPQIICPVMFDQEFWAEHLSWKQLAVRCSSLKQLTDKELIKALKSSCSGGDMAKRIEELACELFKENGVKTALNEIKKIMML